MIMVHLHICEDKTQLFGHEEDLFLIAAFNKMPKEITGENIGRRVHRPFLLKITEELNTHNVKMFDVLDIAQRLQQLRKSGRLGNRSSATVKSMEAIDG